MTPQGSQPADPNINHALQMDHPPLAWYPHLVRRNMLIKGAIWVLLCLYSRKPHLPRGILIPTQDEAESLKRAPLSIMFDISDWCTENVKDSGKSLVRRS